MIQRLSKVGFQSMQYFVKQTTKKECTLESQTSHTIGLVRTHTHISEPGSPLILAHDAAAKRTPFFYPLLTLFHARLFWLATARGADHARWALSGGTTGAIARSEGGVSGALCDAGCGGSEGAGEDAQVERAGGVGAVV